MKALIIPTIISILFYGCFSHEKTNIYIGEFQHISFFSDTLTLQGEKISISNMGAITIDVVDTFLIFAGNQLDTFYNINSKYTYQHCGNFIPQGRGKNELPTIGYPIFGRKEKNNSLLYLRDISTGTIKALNLTQSCAKKTTIFTDTPIDVKRILGLKYLYPINDSICFIHGRSHNSNNDYYALYNTRNLQTTILDSIYTQAITDGGNIFLYNTFGCFNQPQEKYATAMQFFNQINIYNLSGQKTHIALSVNKQSTRLKDVEETAMPDKLEFYEDLICTDSLLFAVYANRTRKDWALLEDVPVNIHVFDWNGNPLYLICLKEKIAKIAIDEDNKILYGMTLGENVYKYDLKKVL